MAATEGITRFFVLLLLLCTGNAGAQGLRFNEIMYHPPDTERREFIELVVSSGGDLTGFSVTGGITFFFPEGMVLQQEAVVLLAADPQLLRGSYGTIPPEVPVLPFSGRLSNGGETLQIRDPDGRLLQELTYDDDPPWPFLADGFGKSLARLCPETNAADPVAWQSQDPTPGRPNSEVICPPPVPPPPPVVINEVMYHPEGRGVDERRYEFIELFNRSAQVQELSGWKLRGGVFLDIAPGTRLDPGAFLVVAADPEKLKEAYPNIPAPVVGPFEGDLDNGGQKVALLDSGGREIDSVTYDDDMPWPLRADGYGEIPGRGASLERLCADKPSGLINNWKASPPDGATPGEANSLRTCALPVIVLSASRSPPEVSPGQDITITFELSGALPAGELRCVYFTKEQLEDPQEIHTAPLEALGEARYTAHLPGQPAGTMVRWRIERLGASGWETFLPEPDTPRALPWRGFFVPPQDDSSIAVYHLLITPANWAQMRRNIAPGRADPSGINPNWNARVPAVFAHASDLYDVQIRYQGSQWHRLGGFHLTGLFTCPKPEDQDVRALSLRVQFPRYDQFRGRKVIILNKIHHYQRLGRFFWHGLQTLFGYRLFAEAGVPAPRASFVHVTVNGCPYLLAAEVERPGEEFLNRYFEGDGDLFKATGCPRNGASWAKCFGPYDWADGRVLSERPPWSLREVYAYSYDRKTRRFDPPDVLIDLIESLHNAAAQGPAALREALTERFSVDEVLTYLATSNWGAAWDDIWQNYYLFLLHADGKWRVFPWDMDQMFGGPCCCAAVSAETSLWRGRSADPDNWSLDRAGPVYNKFKDYFFTAFPEDYFFRLVQLNNEVFLPDRLLDWIDTYHAVLAQEAPRSPIPIEGSLGSFVQTIKNFIVRRHQYVNEQVIPAVSAGSDTLTYVDEITEFDASSSDPPPGPDVAYTWSNGMSGETPKWVFTEAGTQLITLVVTKTLRLGSERTQASRSASVVVRVLPSPHCTFACREGTVAFEAESFQTNHAGFRAFAGARWELSGDDSASGGHAVKAVAPKRIHEDEYALVAPELNWWVTPDAPGYYLVWVRAKAGTEPRQNWFYGGVNHHSPPRQDPVSVPASDWRWVSFDMSVDAAQPVLLSLWLSDPEVTVDKLVVTRDLTFFPSPEDTGPQSSGQACTFLRGDATMDGRVNLADPIAILRALYGRGQRLRCVDAADADDSGQVDLADPIWILSYLFAGGPPPAAPFPQPGVDPTAGDPLDC